MLVKIQAFIQVPAICTCWTAVQSSLIMALWPIQHCLILTTTYIAEIVL